MTPEEKVQWVKALRSGEYKQGKGKLKNTVRGQTYFCCLGVARDLFKLKTGKEAGYGFFQGIDGNWLDTGLQKELVRMNDRGEPFTDIANFIEHRI